MPTKPKRKSDEKRGMKKQKTPSPKRSSPVNTNKITSLLNKLDRAENVQEVMAVTEKINKLTKAEKVEFRKRQGERIKKMKENLTAYTPQQRLYLFQAFWNKFS